MSGGVTRGDLATLRGKKRKEADVGLCIPRMLGVSALDYSTSLKSCFLFFLHLAFSSFYSCEAEEHNWRRLPQTSDQGQASLEAWGGDLDRRGIEVLYIGLIYRYIGLFEIPDHSLNRCVEELRGQNWCIKEKVSLFLPDVCKVQPEKPLHGDVISTQVTDDIVIF